MNTLKTVSTRLRSLRGNITQKEISEKLGITKSSWAMYERGERIPRDEVKVRIADYFGKSVQSLFYDDYKQSKCSQ